MSNQNETFDVTIHDHGSICTLTLSSAAREWYDENVQEGGLSWLVSRPVVEPRYLQPLVAAMIEAGLTVRM